MKQQSNRHNLASLGFWGFFLLVSAFVQNSFGSATATLPAGIHSPSLRRGWVTGIDQKYVGDGSLWNLGATKAVVFNAANLSKFNDRAQQLVEALNRFGTAELGDNINFGVLTPETKPQIDYWAPVFARGISPSWTLGVGVPVVHYQNSIDLKIRGSNLEYYRTQFAGLSAELDEAFATDLVHETHQTLRQRGYKPLDDKNETFLGDLQLASLYRFWEKRDVSALYGLTVSLPTGPQYDPDDLAALNIFGRTSVENKVTMGWKMSSAWEIAPSFAYLFHVPDRVKMRVPTDEDDVLPDESTKETLERRLGGIMTIGSDLFYSVTEQWTLGAGYFLSEKTRDVYTGSQAKRYDLLGRNTDSQSHKVSASVSFSTVQSFLAKKSLLPAVVSVNVSDTIAGRNTERKTFQEMSFMMFF